MKFEIQWFGIEGVALLHPRRFEDARGWFSETWNSDALRAAGFSFATVQDNHSLSRCAGTVRGLHLQAAPFAQAKLVRVLRGAVRDVVVDLRPESATFGRWLASTLDAQDGAQLFVPRGFAHGFCTLTADTEVFYKVDAPYAPGHAAAIRFDDPELAIDWQLPTAEAVLSDADRQAVSFDDWRRSAGHRQQGVVSHARTGVHGDHEVHRDVAFG